MFVDKPAFMQNVNSQRSARDFIYRFYEADFYIVLKNIEQGDCFEDDRDIPVRL